MKIASSVKCIPVFLAALMSLAACKNDGANPVLADDRAATTTGTGAGNSVTGATGGTATSPGAYGTQNPAAATPGTSGAATTGGTGMTYDSASGSPNSSGTPQPAQNPNNTPSR